MSRQSALPRGRGGQTIGHQGAIATLARQPSGAPVLVVLTLGLVALGLLAYALYCFALVRHARIRQAG